MSIKFWDKKKKIKLEKKGTNQRNIYHLENIQKVARSLQLWALLVF